MYGAEEIPLFAHGDALEEGGEGVIYAQDDLDGDHEVEEILQARGGLDAEEC